MCSCFFSRSNLLALYLFLLNAFPLLMGALMFYYSRMFCEGENISTNVFRFDADSVQLFSLQSDQLSFCITEGTCNDASFRLKVTGVC